jgi:hypothetical protein
MTIDATKLSKALRSRFKTPQDVLAKLGFDEDLVAAAPEKTDKNMREISIGQLLNFLMSRASVRRTPKKPATS